MNIVVNTSGSIAGGAVTHLRNILPAMASLRAGDEIRVIGSPELRAVLDPPPDLPWIDARVDFANLPRRLYWENTRLPRILGELAADVVFHPSNVAIYRSPVPQVNLVHNLAPFLPEIISGESLYQRGRLRLLRTLTLDSLRRAQRTIFVSHWGRSRVREAASPSDRDDPVIYFGSDHAAQPADASLLQRWGLEADRFLLSVSHFYRYKCLVELVEAYGQLGDLADENPLVLVGRPYDAGYAAAVRAAAERVRGRVVFTDSLSAPEIASLMQSCRAFPYTSAVENLPITLLEAMRAGALIITSRACSMPEVCGDAALYASAPTAAGYAEALKAGLGDAALRSRLREKARERGATFRWEEAASKTLAVLREVARGSTHD